MVSPQASMFWQLAAKSGLLDAKKLEKCWEALPPEKREQANALDRRLARQAVVAGFLTVWQAQQLLAGRYQGLRIDRYELQDLLGQGGMGRVYLARDSKLRRLVALKILSRERLNNPRALARFRREARVGAQLQHENLIRVYDDGESHGLRFLVMEYIPGLTVGKMIGEQGRLPFPLAAGLARQVALGLEHLHQKGLLHRDVNPMNILVDRDGTAKLTDLGLAIDPSDDEEAIVTRDGATVGTFDYISPEQARSSRQVDTRSDIYSLGCSLFQMISGRVPFPAMSLPEKLFAHQSTDPESLTMLVPGVPEGLDAIVHRMMAKKPGDRFARPRDVARALEPYASLATVSASFDPETPLLVRNGRSDSATAAENGQPTPKAPAPTVSALSSSDPSLDVPPPGVAVASTDPSDPFKIDFGPPEPLSKNSSSSRTGEVARPGKRLWIAFGLLILIGVGIALLARWLTPEAAGSRKDGAEAVTNSRGQGQTIAAGTHTPTIKAEPLPELVVQYDDGTSHAPRDLREAIMLAAGKAATVVLRNKEPLKLDVTSPLTLAGTLSMRAAPDTSPAILVNFGAAPTAATLFSAPVRARIHLEGLTFRLNVAKPGQAAVFINTFGQVTLNRCSIVASPDAHAARLLLTQGSQTKLEQCWIEGFDTPIDLSLFPGSQFLLSGCMIVRPIATGPTPGWVINARPLMVVSQESRTITFDHCTIAGLGLLSAGEFTKEGPGLQLQVQRTAISAPALLAWAGAFPDGLSYEGQANLYRITGNGWVVQSPNGQAPIPGSPTNLVTWATGPIHESESRPQNFHFQNDAAVSGHLPADYTLLDVDPPKPGADPDQVGPLAKAP